jgi:Aerotolerance regulator N-terminal
MQFIQIGMLGALGALSIPIIIHLMFRQRARPVDLGTLQFLKIVLRDNARRRRLKRWILLAMRMACVALIAFLFARPYMFATEAASGDRLVVALLDRSASMGLAGGARPIEQALAEARAIVGRAGTGTQVEAASFDRIVQPFAHPADLNKAAIEPTAGGTDFGAALAWARDLLVRSRKPFKELHILTDLQRSGLDRGESVSIPADVEVHLRDFGRAFPKNVAVTGVTVAPQTVRPGEAVSITATVLNASPLPVSKSSVRLHLEAGERKRDLERTIELDGGATSSVVFSFDAMPEGLWRGHVELATADELPFDNRRFLAFQVAPPARVLLVDGDPGRAPYESETYFLQAALRLAPPDEKYAKTPFDPRTVALVSGTGLPNLDKTEAVVLANVEGLSASDAKRLSEFVDRGGGLLVFTGDRVKAEGARVLEAAGLGVGEVLEVRTATELPWRLERWDLAHLVFKPFADPEHGDLRRPAFTAITPIKPDRDAHVLASFRGGEPALLERTKGRAKVLWFTSACDLAWGNWPRGRMYLPMIHQMVGYVSGLAEGGRVRQEFAGDDRKPGVFESDGLVHVVNPDPLESETARCTPKEFAGRFGFTLPEPAATQLGGQGGRRMIADDRLRTDEIWPWLALTLVGMLLVENFLANRTAA